MKRYGILAYPAKHSLSPVIHNAGFKALGIDAEYGVFEIPESEFENFVKYVRDEPIDGLSVSLPYKEHVMQFLDEVDEDAKKIGAVNTVVNRGGFLYGYNTDFIGSNNALKEIVGDLVGKRVVVLGAGGSAKAVVYGLLKEGAIVSIFNRTAEKAVSMAKHFSGMFGVDVFAGGFSEIGDVENAGILIHTTSIWLNGDGFDGAEFLNKEFVNKFETVMDIVYKPLITPLLGMAVELGKKVIPGDRMLLYQAVGQFELWTAQKAPVEEMKMALEKAL